MPNNLPPWEAVYQQTQRWLLAACFEAPVHDRRTLLRVLAERQPQPSAAILDSRPWMSRTGPGGPPGRPGAGAHLITGPSTLGHVI